MQVSLSHWCFLSPGPSPRPSLCPSLLPTSSQKDDLILVPALALVFVLVRYFVMVLVRKNIYYRRQIMFEHERFEAYQILIKFLKLVLSLADSIPSGYSIVKDQF